MKNTTVRKLCLTIIVAAALMTPLAAFAQQPKTVGVGIILGQPTGLSAKFWMDQTSAIDLAAAWQFLPTGAIYVHADYLYHIYHVFPIKEGALPLYVGVGGSATVQTNPTIGIRVPVGIDYLFQNVPLDAFLEVGFGLSLYPATQFQGSGGIGIRYNF